VVTGVGIMGKMPEAEQVQRHESTQRAVKIQKAYTGRVQRCERGKGMNGHSEQCGFGQRASHPKDARWGSSVEKE
jgi:hypothetical protein